MKSITPNVRRGAAFVAVTVGLGSAATALILAPSAAAATATDSARVYTCSDTNNLRPNGENAFYTASVTQTLTTPATAVSGAGFTVSDNLTSVVIDQKGGSSLRLEDAPTISASPGRLDIYYDTPQGQLPVFATTTTPAQSLGNKATQPTVPLSGTTSGQSGSVPDSGQTAVGIYFPYVFELDLNLNLKDGTTKQLPVSCIAESTFDAPAATVVITPAATVPPTTTTTVKPTTTTVAPTTTTVPPVTTTTVAPTTTTVPPTTTTVPPVTTTTVAPTTTTVPPTTTTVPPVTTTTVAPTTTTVPPTTTTVPPVTTTTVAPTTTTVPPTTTTVPPVTTTTVAPTTTTVPPTTTTVPPTTTTPPTAQGNQFYLAPVAGGPAGAPVAFGNAGDTPIAGDFDGDGTSEVGTFKGNTWTLRKADGTTTTFTYGRDGDQPIVGDWNGDGTDTIGVYRQGTVYERNTNTTGVADVTYNYGKAGDVAVAVAGDFNGDKTTTVGVRRGNVWYLTDAKPNLTGSNTATTVTAYGQASDTPVVGDYDGNGTDTMGVVRGNQWYLSNDNTSSFTNLQFTFGKPGDLPFTGKFGGSSDGVGVFRSGTTAAS